MVYRAGVDLGSVSTKCVVVKDSEILSFSITKTGTSNEKSADNVFYEAIEKAGIAEKDIELISSTGYGRRLFKKAGKVVTEISAAAAGAWALGGKKKCLVLDVGGQDTKVVELDTGGEVADFLMNDKCAAGTGRFVEMMAHVLETDIEGISGLAVKSANPVKINATCSVFAESEVISLLASANKKEDIALGLFEAVSARIAGMIRQFDEHKCIYFCGGGAKNEALKRSIEKNLGMEISVLPNPQFVVAYGAAIVKQGIGSRG